MATEVDRLVVVFDANFQRMEEKLNKVIKSNYAAAAKVEKAWSGKTFKGLTDAAGRLPGVGAAIGALAGPAAAAGAAVLALNAAFAGAEAAAAFADDIADTAGRLHVTTDALQEYRFAIVAAGGDTEGADAALEAFSETLGKAQEGLPKAKKAFDALKLDPNQFKSSEEALLAVTKALEGLSDAQKDALISQFGLSGLKPLIQGGVEEMIRLRKEAHTAGAVMDASLVKRGAALKDQIDQTRKAIEINLHEALVNLGPVIVYLLGLLEQFTGVIQRIADGFASIENKSTAGLRLQQRSLIREVARLGTREVAGTIEPSQRTALRLAEARLAEVNAELAAREKLNVPPPPTKSVAGAFAKATGTTKAEVLQAIEILDTISDQERQNIADLKEILRLRGIVEDADKPKLGDVLQPGSDFVAAADGLQGEVEDNLQRLHENTYLSVYDGIRGGLEAGFREGLPGVLRYLQDALTRSVLDSIAEGLTDALLQKGGSSGFVKGLASIFGRGYADGTMSSRSGVALVGERGPELVSLPGGSRVISNTALNNVGMLGRPAMGATIIFDNRGAVIWEQAARQMMSYADRVAAGAGGAAVQVSRRATPDDMERRAGRRLGR